VASLSLQSTASATILASDNFATANGGFGFDPGDSWEQHDASNGWINLASGNESFRAFSNPIPVSTLDKIYIRFDFADNDGDGALWGGLSPFNGDGERLFIGNPFNPNDFGITNFDAGEDLVSSTPAVPISDTNFHTLIVEVDIDAVAPGTHQFTLWVDNTNINSPNATGARQDLQDTWTRIRFGSDGNEPFRADNLTIATTAGEVGLIPEPASVGLLGLGALMLGGMRRRRS
jgi:hypothetical protein